MKKKPFVTVLVVLILLLIIGGSYLFNRNKILHKLNDRQAVFLTNGQVYFGKIKGIDNGVLVLSDVYYLRSQDQIQSGRSLSGKKLALAKLGNEIHSPEDAMYINMDHVLFYENMNNQSKVNDAIARFVNGQDTDSETDTTASPSPSASPIQ